MPQSHTSKGLTRCKRTKLLKPECHCATCQGELERKHRPCCGQGCSRCMRENADPYDGLDLTNDAFGI